MSDGHFEPDVDRFIADLRHWADDDRAAEASRSRSRTAWLGQQAAESTTLLGVLITLAESESVVTVRAAGRPFAGRVGQVTTSFCTVDLTTPAGSVALIPVPAIIAVEGGRGDIADDRVPQAGAGFPALLAAVAAGRPPVELFVSDGAAVAGALVNVGVDVVSVRQHGLPTSVVHIPLGAITACVLL
jgi:hypothetical protein